MRDIFNPSTYMVIDRITGEEVDVAIFIEEARQAGWEKAYAKTLAEYINCGGSKATKLLAYLIRERDGSNLIHGTQREICKSSGVSISTVTIVFSTLLEKGMMKKVRSGCYMVSPKMIRNGGVAKGSMMLRLWGEIDEGEGK